MTVNQEDALYEFLENVTEPFTLDNVVSFVRMAAPQKTIRLAMEITALINSRNIAFRLGEKRWVSRRGCFESARFVISPTRLELVNGILIPGHRCVPFANPLLMPQELSFYWKGKPIPLTTTEGPPEDFYPYYTIYGEEYAPQYVAKDNPDNENAFNEDPFEDPAEVSIHTFDMRAIYRETGFVPGDRFVAACRDWKAGAFNLEKIGKNEWSRQDLYDWFEAAEAGFEGSFQYLGPGVSTDEQIAFAYWYGGERMRNVPAWSLEEFLYEETEKIETAPYGIETRFWYAGREIPDRTSLEGAQTLADRTYVEETLLRNGVPISEFVIQSYIRDALFRGDTQIPDIVERIVPLSVRMDSRDLSILADYVIGALEEFSADYGTPDERMMGSAKRRVTALRSIRRRVAELHTAVIDLSSRLLKGERDTSWLPKHTFAVLSQIQSHAAGILEDLDSEEPPPEMELETMDNSLDSMLDTYGDIKELIEDAVQNRRRSSLSLIRPADSGSSLPAGSAAPAAAEETAGAAAGRSLQVSLGGADIWRRLSLAGDFRLDELHRVISAIFGWKEGPYRFFVTRSSGFLRPASGEGSLFPSRTIRDLAEHGVAELRYEYSGNWDVKIILLEEEPLPAGSARIRCAAGAGAPPPGGVENPLAYRKLLAAEGKNSGDYRPGTAGYFSVTECNRLLAALFAAGEEAEAVSGKGLSLSGTDSEG
ncbi:MAG: plasmid pRiA4b ORF-3 family protein [Spirochaetaceae bacterium]|jgi:hypothetical protein|nr:plasmid pRiA4b ORF-3 family protein [Spirochaetaceae bacterium]